jgi:hypothetical protein
MVDRLQFVWASTASSPPSRVDWPMTRPPGVPPPWIPKSKPVIVVAKFDRLFRAIADAAQTIVDFDQMGIELVAGAEGFDMTNPYGRAMEQMASVV